MNWTSSKLGILHCKIPCKWSWRKIFVIHISDRQVYKIYEEPSKLIVKPLKAPEIKITSFFKN